MRKIHANGCSLEAQELEQRTSEYGHYLVEKEVVVEMKCAYREYILLDIMDEINNLYLDVHSVQSSTTDGILTLTLKSKVCAKMTNLSSFL